MKVFLEENQNAEASAGQWWSGGLAAVSKEQKEDQHNWGTVRGKKPGENEVGGLGSCQIWGATVSYCNFVLNEMGVTGGT